MDGANEFWLGFSIIIFKQSRFFTYLLLKLNYSFSYETIRRPESSVYYRGDQVHVYGEYDKDLPLRNCYFIWAAYLNHGHQIISVTTKESELSYGDLITL